MEKLDLIRNANGKIMTADELEEHFIDRVCEALDDLDSGDLLDVCNEYRENTGSHPLYFNESDRLDDELCDISPSDLLYMGRDDWDSYDDYFYYSYSTGLMTTDDVYYDIDKEDMAREILHGEFSPDTYAFDDIIEDYGKAKLLLKNHNKYRAMADEVIRKYTNCEADVTDLLQVLDKLVKTDEAWSGKENN